MRRSHLALGAAGLVLVALGSLLVGVGTVTPSGLLAGDAEQGWLVLASRLPRLLAVLLSGAAMAVAGLVMQHLARNRFVAPSTAGTVECAGLGLLVATTAFGSASVIAKMSLGVLFALLGTGAFLLLVRRLHLADALLVPLVGLMFGAVVRGVTTFVAYRADLLQTVEAWATGDLSGVVRGRYELLWLAAAVTVLAYRHATRLTLAGMGRDTAVSLGLRYEREVVRGLAIVAVVTGVVVVVVGAVPFLGLVVPNLVTLALGDDLRRALPITAGAGAGLVLVCDVLGRLVRFPYEVPVGTVAGVVGSLLFLVLVLRSRRATA